MSLDPPPFLGTLQSNIRQRPIPWDGAARAGTITEGQLAKIRAVDKVKKEQRKKVVEGDLDGYRILFVGGGDEPSVVESASRRSDVVQYILVLLSDLLDGSCHAPSSSPWTRCHGAGCRTDTSLAFR
jgi:V-type H+-transporting ATPase subunit H